MDSNRFLVVTALPFLLSALPAQSSPAPFELIGLTGANSALRTERPENCAPTHQCAIAGLPGANAAWAGGTAFDATTGEVWVSNGNLMARVDPRTCAVTCGPYPAPSVNLVGVVTGMDAVESQNLLLLMDSEGAIMTLSLSGSCQAPSLITSCSTGLNRRTDRVTSGLASDEKNGLVFYSYSDFIGGGTRLFVATLANRCMPFHNLALPSCAQGAFGPARGLACDGCRQVLYVTDGLRTMALPYQYDAAHQAITFGAPRCCQPGPTISGPMIGLGIKPSAGEPAGQPCANGSCRPCPNRHSIATAPTIGNPNVLFALEEAQSNSLTWLALGAGPCRQNGPIIPPLCGPVLISLAARPLVSGPYPVASTTGGPCTGRVQIVVRFPMDPQLCGTVWSSQFLSICASTLTLPGTAISNCWTFVITGS